jgi:hypothetical protein
VTADEEPQDRGTNRQRVNAAWALALSLFFAAAFVLASFALLWVSFPRFVGVDLPLVIGVGGVLIGSVWIWRISNATAKYEGRSRWRYRDR